MKDALSKSYELESIAHTLYGIERDECLSTGQKLDIVYSLENAIEAIEELQERLTHEVMDELREFLKERKLC